MAAGAFFVRAAQGKRAEGEQAKVPRHLLSRHLRSSSLKACLAYAGRIAFEEAFEDRTGGIAIVERNIESRQVEVERFMVGRYFDA